jgi:hypothetical protein
MMTSMHDVTRLAGPSTRTAAAQVRLADEPDHTATSLFAAPAALGSAVALLAYATIQLAQAAGHPWVRIEADTIPLFARWRVAALIGLLTALLSSALIDRRSVATLTGWCATIASVALVLVVIVAP